jgi:branched-subunit amino acid ABC-type transport system permease component
LDYALDGVPTLAWGGLTHSYHKFIPATGFHVGPVSIKQPYLWSFAAAIIFFMLFFLFFRYSKQGLTMQIVSEDHQIACSLGIEVKTPNCRFPFQPRVSRAGDESQPVTTVPGRQA